MERQQLKHILATFYIRELKMNKRYHNLANIVFDMVALNTETNIHRQEAMNALPVIARATEYQTISYNPGRQCGKTTLISRIIDKGDLVLTYNLASQKKLEDLIKAQSPHSHPIPVCNVRALAVEYFDDNILQFYDTIWVDEPSCMLDDAIALIYKTFAGKCNRFVFLG